MRHLTFKEFGGERSVKDGPLTTGSQLLPLKLQKHNIGTKEKPKLVSI